MTLSETRNTTATARALATASSETNVFVCTSCAKLSLLVSYLMQNCKMFDSVNHTSVRNIAFILYGNLILLLFVLHNLVVVILASLQRPAGQKELLCKTPTRCQKAIHTRKHAHSHNKKEALWLSNKNTMHVQ